MPTGPEHYKLAEAALEVAGRAEPDSAQERYSVAAAHAHATLALAAATALSHGLDASSRHAWKAAVEPPAASVKP